MGASTSFTKWHPEDDLLLKNAVEAGASLESLAKGAVHFSQRFTVRELEDRWCSLLYDLNTSTEASARIIEIEIGASINNPLKSGRACNSKAKETSYNKRKGESLQCRYYTARKKARSEPHKPLKLAFIISPSSHAAIASDISASDQFKLQNEFELIKYPTHIPFTDDYGHPETIYGCNQRVYPKIVDTAPPSTLTFHGGMVDSIETSLPAGISGTDCLYGHVENTPIPLDEVGFNDASENFEPNLTQKKYSHALDRNNCPSQMLDAPESRSSFHHLGYSTSPSGPPIWKAIEDSSTPTIQMDGQFEDKGRGAVNIRCINKIDDQPCDNTSKNKLIDGTSAASNNSTIPLEANFIDFSDSCMSFTDDEELLLIDVDDDDVEDRSCLNDIDTVFIGSPAAADMDNLHIPNEIKPSEVFDVPFCNDAGSSLEQEIIREELHTDNSDLHISVVPAVSILTSSSGSSPIAVAIEKLMICVLNTEDKDIPCNDDATFPAKFFQAFPIHLKQDISSSLAHDGKITSADCSLAKEGKTGMLPIVSNVKAGQSVLPKVSLLQPTADCKLESALSEKDLLYQSSTTLAKDIDDPSLIPSVIPSHFAPGLSLKQEATTETNLHVSCLSSHPELVSSELGSVDLLPTMSISDDEQFPENEEEDEDDVPYFSDVEDLILGMDLDPYDQESCLFTKEVSRYQCMNTKKTIIRLEQSARSYVNRAISSHGAFAIFYGRRLKYFIKSPEVLLGRETEDIKVDIDLGKEGRANKISRRQAIIKMDEDGYFHLKNIGKSSIFVNSKEVPAKKRINLCLSALIEIKDMRFLFEVNERALRRHVASIQRVSSHQPKSEFDFPYS